jgi:hypothetical protein
VVGWPRPLLDGQYLPSLAKEFLQNAPVAQLDRAAAYGAVGWGFDSLQAHDQDVELLSSFARRELPLLPADLQKVSLVCPSCKKGLSMTLQQVFKRASVPCPHCQTEIQFQAGHVSRVLQMMGDAEKAAKRVEEVRVEYMKSVERFKAAVADLVKTVRASP